MVTSRGAAFTITAQDKASKVVDTISQKFAGQTQRIGTLVRAYGALNRSMLALSVGLPVLISAMGAMAGAADAIKFVELERASRRSRIQLQLMGLTATDAASSVGILTEALDRGTATTFLQSSKAVASIAVAGTELTREMALAAGRMSTIMGVDFVKAFDALFAARVLDDPEPLQQLIGGLEDLGLAVDGIDPNDAQGLANAVIALVDKENITQAEGLAAAFSRIGELTAPGRQAVEEFVAGFLNIMVTTLAERLEAQQENFKTAILAGLSTMFIFSGRGLGKSLAIGILGGMAAMVLTDMGVTFRAVMENKQLSFGVFLAATILGLATGRWLLSGIFALVAWEFVPGIAEVFDKLETSVKWGIIVGGLVTAIALAMKAKLKVAFGLGVLLGEIASDLESGKDKKAEIMEAGFILLGGALGALIGRNMRTALVGAFLGKELFKKLADEESNFKELGEQYGRAIASGIGEGSKGIGGNLMELFLDEFNLRKSGTLAPDESTWKAFQPDLNPFDEWPFTDKVTPGASRNTREENRRLWQELHGEFRRDLFPDPSQGEFQPPSGFPQIDRIPGASFQQQSFRGSSLPIRPNGGSSNSPIVVQLVLDKRIIGEVAINAVNRQVRFRSGVVQGAAGV